MRFLRTCSTGSITHNRKGGRRREAARDALVGRFTLAGASGNFGRCTPAERIATWRSSSHQRGQSFATTRELATFGLFRLDARRPETSRSPHTWDVFSVFRPKEFSEPGFFAMCDQPTTGLRRPS